MTAHQPSSLELQALAVLWEHGPSTVRAIRDELPDGRERVHFTNVFHGSRAGLVERVRSEAAAASAQTPVVSVRLRRLMSAWQRADGAANQPKQIQPNVNTKVLAAKKAAKKAVKKAPAKKAAKKAAKKTAKKKAAPAAKPKAVTKARPAAKAKRAAKGKKVRAAKKAAKKAVKKAPAKAAKKPAAKKAAKKTGKKK